MSRDLDDVAQALEAIRAAVRRRAGYASAAEVPPLGHDPEIAQAADAAHVSAHLPVTWETPVVGRAVAFARRVERLMLRWYINPVVEQQNAFNESVVRALTTLEARQRELVRRLEALEQQDGQADAAAR